MNKECVSKLEHQHELEHEPEHELEHEPEPEHENYHYLTSCFLPEVTFTIYGQ